MRDLYEVQDMLDGAYALLDAISDEVNALITENERIKAKYAKRVISDGLKDLERNITQEEQMYLDYYKEYYGKEVE